MVAWGSKEHNGIRPTEGPGIESVKETPNHLVDEVERLEDREGRVAPDLTGVEKEVEGVQNEVSPVNPPTTPEIPPRTEGCAPVPGGVDDQKKNVGSVVDDPEGHG